MKIMFENVFTFYCCNKYLRYTNLKRGKVYFVSHFWSFHSICHIVLGPMERLCIVVGMHCEISAYLMTDRKQRRENVSRKSLQGCLSLSLGSNFQQISYPKCSSTYQQYPLLVTTSLTYRPLEDIYGNHSRWTTCTTSQLNSKPTCYQVPGKTFPTFEIFISST